MAALPWQGQAIDKDGTTDQDRGWGICVSHKDDHPIPPKGWNWASHAQDERRVTMLWDGDKFCEALEHDPGAFQTFRNASFGFWLVAI